MNNPDDYLETLGYILIACIVCMAIGYVFRYITEDKPLTCAEQEQIRKKEFAVNVYRLNEEWCLNNQKACRLFVMDGK